MKMIKRTWMLLAVLFAVFAACPAALYASSADAAGRYDAVECRQGDNDYTCDGEYLLLNEDGTGEVLFNDETYELTWTLDGEDLSFTDENDYICSGTLKDGVIEALVYDYEYVYQMSEASSEDKDDASAAVKEDASAADEDDSAMSDMADLFSGKKEGSPVVYNVTSREKVSGASGETEDDYAWKIDYIALNEDGSGIFVFNKAAFSILWEQDGSTFSFTDHLGNSFKGTIDGSIISGQYGRYRYTFEDQGESLPVYDVAPEKWNKGLDPVTDIKGVLSADQKKEITERAKKLSEEYDVGIYLALLDSRDKYTWSSNIETLGEEICAGYSLGIGYTEKKSRNESESVNPNWKDTILLTVAFDCRKYDIYAAGEYGKWAFSDYAKEHITDSFTDDFGDNNWVSGIYQYMDAVEDVLKVSSKGKQYSFRNSGMGFLIGILVPLILALLFGFGIAAVMRSSMQNTSRARNAAEYVAGDQVNFTRRQDRYIRTIVSRVYSPREKKSGGGGGGGGFSSSGGSHASGSF